MTPEERSARARVAAHARHHPDDPKTAELAADFKADQLEKRVKKLVDAAPPLTPEARARIAGILRGRVS